MRLRKRIAVSYTQLDVYNRQANPKAGKGLFAIRLFIDKAENEFPLASAVARIDNLGNVAAVHKVFENGKLLLLAAGNNKLPLLRDNGKILSLIHI